MRVAGDHSASPVALAVRDRVAPADSQHFLPEVGLMQHPRLCRCAETCAPGRIVRIRAGREAELKTGDSGSDIDELRRLVSSHSRARAEIRKSSDICADGVRKERSMQTTLRVEIHAVRDSALDR